MFLTEASYSKKIDKFLVEIETEDKLEGTINYQNLKWTKKETSDLFKVGDIIFVRKINNNDYSLMQLPEVNGAIVVNGSLYLVEY